MNAPLNIPMSQVGQPVSRVDGHAKVTGQAKYAAEFNVPDLLYGVVVSSTIAKGTIKRLDTEKALAVPGVVKVFTHENRPRTAWFSSNYQDQTAPPGTPFRALYDEKVVYSGQPIALVVAEAFEVARFAASLVTAEYEVETHATSLKLAREEARAPKKQRSGIEGPAKPRGDADAAYAKADAKLKAEYVTPVEHHNPMEPHATTVIWEGDGKITVHDKTQGVQNVQNYVTAVFGYAKDDARVLSPYMGGGFGSGLRPQYQVFLAVMAATDLQRSVRVTLTRQQMFTFTYRSETLQTVSLGANRYGKLESLMHEAIGMTSRFEEYQENVVNWGEQLYDTPNAKLGYKLAPLDLYTPGDMRAPGAAQGSFALECAMDELSYELGIDPLQLRLTNYSEKDQAHGTPYTSKALREAYRQGAERFGWAGRKAEPRSMQDGRELVGWGMATGIWESQQQKASARVVLSPDGRLEVSSAASDIGTGTYTIMAQVGAEMLGLPIASVSVKLGDSSLPTCPVAGGSWTAASVGSAIFEACLPVRERVFKLAQRINSSPLAGAELEDVAFAQERIALKADPSRFVTLSDTLRLADGPIEEETSASPGLIRGFQYARFTHSAVFVEVKVDEELGAVRVTRVVNAVAAGTILNPKTARSQILGGVVMGIGMALEEETLTDHQLGRHVNHNLAEYHVPVNADIHDIEVIFVEEPDEIVNQLGIKGLGEIGIVGTAAAIANAVHHATGVRVRDLPITLDKLLG